MKKKNCEKPITKLLNKNNKCIENRQEMTEEFNNFFPNIGPTLANKIPSANICNPIVDSSSHQNSFFLERISPIEVFREIMHLKENKANGSENIPTKYIKLAGELLAPMLCNTFNQCLLKGKFPKNLKIAKIKPIYKSGPKELMTNYRPVSMLSPFAKIFERLINNRLTSYLSQFNIINQEQFGFQKEHSTSLLIADVISQIKILKEKKHHNCVILLDLKKAFDTVDHKTLFTKLQNYGIRGNALDLFQDYLSNRQQYVTLHNVASSAKTIKCGVPQGSVLGPTLFTIYIDDIVHASGFTTRLFADDTALILSDSNLTTLEGKVKAELIKITHWLTTNKLTLNYSKTTYILVKNTKNKDDVETSFSLSVNNNIIKKANAAKYLGIIIEPNLKRNLQIQSLCIKLSKAAGIISKLRHYVDMSTLRLIYFSLVHLHVLYGILSWGSEFSTNLQTIPYKIKLLQS